MGIGFVIVGLVLIVTAAQNTYAQLGAQLQKDFTGKGNFTYWIVAIGLVGALGYIPALKKFSTWFMALILLALFLSKGTGFFSQLQAALAKGPVPPNGAPPGAVPGQGTAQPASPSNATPQGPAAALGLPGGSGGMLPYLFGQNTGSTLNQWLFGNP